MNKKEEKKYLYSFILDPFLLAGTAFLVVLLSERIGKNKSTREKKKLTAGLLVLAITIFWFISGSLYLNIIDMPFLGEYGRGNHFMWNSGFELVGIAPFVDTSVPTYTNLKSPINILGVLLFLAYLPILYFFIKYFEKKRSGND